MKKVLSFIFSVTLVISMLVPFMTANAASDFDWFYAQPDGTIVYTPDFNGEKGVYEPCAFSGTPSATVDPTNSNSILFQTTQNKTASYWGGFIETLPLNETTCYTIYYTVTRSGNHSIGVYCDSVYGAYGYPDKIKLMNYGKSLPGGHEYVNFETAGISVPTLDTSSVTQEYALEVNGINSKIAIYVKNNAGEYTRVDESNDGDIPYFNADILGLFFYSYYSGHLVTVSNCYIVKGLSFGTAVIPETTEAPDTTKAPETSKPEETTEAPKDETTEAPEAPEADTTKAPEAPETTKAPEKSGCSSTVATGAVLAIVGCAVPAFLRKKRR